MIIITVMSLCFPLYLAVSTPIILLFPFHHGSQNTAVKEGVFVTDRDHRCHPRCTGLAFLTQSLTPDPRTVYQWQRGT